MRIILGIILAVVGAVITIKSEALFRTFGRVPFAEKYLGTEGGSRLFYQLLGVLIIIIGFMFITNLVGGIFDWIGRSLFGGFAGP
ncbi:MAG TPA: hypothetical protein VGA49_03465 [Patescibacteria group bacterium]